MPEPFLDIVVPCYRPNADLLGACLQGIVGTVDLPYTLTVYLDGFLEEDREMVNEYLPEPGPRVQLLQSHVIAYPQPVYQKKIACAATEYVSPTAQMIVFIQPQLCLTDPRWVGKVQQPFAADGLAALSLFGRADSHESVDPVRLDLRQHVLHDWNAVAVTSRFLAHASVKLGSDDWTDLHGELVAITDDIGGACWVVPSVRGSVSKAVRYVRPFGTKAGAAVGTTPNRNR